jgi:hypothetical protein
VSRPLSEEYLAAAESQQTKVPFVRELVAEVRRLRGLDGEVWREGERCLCRFAPDTNKTLTICEFHQRLAQELLDAEKERARYKTALEKMVIEGAGRPCVCGCCYVCVARAALGMPIVEKRNDENGPARRGAEENGGDRS